MALKTTRQKAGSDVSEMTSVRALVPGLLAAALLAWLSVVLSDFIGTALMGFDRSPVSEVMVAILLGLIIGTVRPLPGVLKPGFDFAIKKLLRWGIILLGMRLTIFAVFRLGAYGVPIVLFCILCALFLTTRINLWLKLPRRLGTLIAVGTAICGVSAIVATGPTIDAEEEEVAYAIAVITVFGLFATLVYPYLARVVFDGDPVKVGLFLGTAVHDTSQVVGAAKVYADVYASPLVLSVATVTKLVRNVSMIVVIPFMAFNHSRRRRASDGPAGREASPSKLFPRFVLGFLALAVIRSLGDAGVNAGGRAFGLFAPQVWLSLHAAIETWAGRFLVVALSAVGLSTDFRSFKRLGLKPFLAGLAAAFVVGGVSYGAISLLGRWVQL